MAKLDSLGWGHLKWVNLKSRNNLLKGQKAQLGLFGYLRKIVSIWKGKVEVPASAGTSVFRGHFPTLPLHWHKLLSLLLDKAEPEVHWFERNFPQLHFLICFRALLNNLGPFEPFWGLGI